MYQAIIVIHVLVALSIIGLVLLQQGKGADAGAGFGGGASNTLFGARGSASFLTRTTAILAAMFFTTTLFLAYLGGKQDNKAQDLMDIPASTQGPADLPVLNEQPKPADKSDIPTPVEGNTPAK